MRTMLKLSLALVAIMLFTGCAPGQFLRMPPPNVTVDQNGHVHTYIPSPTHAMARAVRGMNGPILYERTRDGGNEMSDGWIEFQSDQSSATFVLDPQGDVASAYVKYKSGVVVRRLRAPNWTFKLPNAYNSGTRDYELYVRREDESEELLMTITVVSSPPASLRSRRR